MNSVFRIQSSELEKLQRKFDRLRDRYGQKVAKKAARAATQPVLVDMRAGTPVESGTLKKSVKKSVRGFRKNSIVIGLVGVARGVSGEFQGVVRIPEFYAHLVEFGRARVTPKKGNKVLTNKKNFFAFSAKAFPGKPFIRPAFDRNRGRMDSIARRELKDGVERVAREVAK